MHVCCEGLDHPAYKHSNMCTEACRTGHASVQEHASVPHATSCARSHIAMQQHFLADWSSAMTCNGHVLQQSIRCLITALQVSTTGYNYNRPSYLRQAANFAAVRCETLPLPLCSLSPVHAMQRQPSQSRISQWV